MLFRKTILAVMLAVAVTFSQQENYHVFGAAIRGPEKSPNSYKNGSKKSGTNSSQDLSSTLCYLEVLGFDPYRKHMKYYKNRDFYVQFSSVLISRSVRFQAMKQAQMSLHDGLVKSFEENSFQSQINDSNIIQSFEFDPSVDLDVGMGYGYHSINDDDDNDYNIEFRSVLFSGVIDYLCDDFLGDEEPLLWELAKILDNQISSSKTPLTKQFSKDFQTLEWNFEDIELTESIVERHFDISRI